LFYSIFKNKKPFNTIGTGINFAKIVADYKTINHICSLFKDSNFSKKFYY